MAGTFSWIYHCVITLDREVRCIWTRGVTVGKVLYLLTRYGPVIRAICHFIGEAQTSAVASYILNQSPFYNQDGTEALRSTAIPHNSRKALLTTPSATILLGFLRKIDDTSLKRTISELIFDVDENCDDLDEVDGDEDGRGSGGGIRLGDGGFPDRDQGLGIELGPQGPESRRTADAKLVGANRGWKASDMKTLSQDKGLIFPWSADSVPVEWLFDWHEGSLSKTPAGGPGRQAIVIVCKTSLGSSILLPPPDSENGAHPGSESTVYKRLSQELQYSHKPTRTLHPPLPELSFSRPAKSTMSGGYRQKDCAIINQTRYEIVPVPDSAQFYSGEWDVAPTSTAPLSTMKFGITDSKTFHFLTGVSGCATFCMTVDLKTVVFFSVGFNNPAFSFRVINCQIGVAAGSKAVDGYNVASGEGNSVQIDVPGRKFKVAATQEKGVLTWKWYTTGSSLSSFHRLVFGNKKEPSAGCIIIATY
ncbi:hypothetical protein DFP72DRAFT_1047243 [Ephemerocybe angulata]|uniref:DUF6533 domain-containing protein n=1 Tax=Ephemerocybe angulata TaxID=980116 RepID=A0A8H6HTS1_9AGAR|nr:hypothetical protein DFP72DRAFT_1047243 [Tulosesus angulatus]